MTQKPKPTPEKSGKRSAGYVPPKLPVIRQKPAKPPKPSK
jgi:hypothetical protein